MICSWNADDAAAPVNPYVDWDRETRPDYLKAKFDGVGAPTGAQFAPAYRPCFVRLNGGTDHEVRRSAEELLEHAQLTFSGDIDLLIRLPDISMRQLKRITETDDHISERQRFIIVYMLESASPKAGSNLFTIVRYGVAVPGLTLRDEKARPGGAEPPPDQEGTLAPQKGASSTPPPVVIAIIDSGIAIANERFCLWEGERLRTRVWHFWRQSRENVTSQENPGFGIGRAFTKTGIDRLLEEARGDEVEFYRRLRKGEHAKPAFRSDPWDAQTVEENVTHDEAFASSGAADPGTLRTIPYTPLGERPIGLRAGHGTWVMDLAAGAPPRHEPPGRPIVAVELPDFAVADTAGQRLEMYALMAVMRIIDWVDDWQGTGKRVPVVINISLGNAAGPRDGTGFFEQALARIVDARNDDGVTTKAVIAAGNNWRDRLSGYASLKKGNTESFDWRVLPGDKSPSYLEIRLPENAELSLRVTTPDGCEEKVAHNKIYSLFAKGEMIGRIYNDFEVGADSSGARKRLVTIALAPTLNLERPAQQALSGRYKVDLHNDGDETIEVSLTVQRDDSLDGWPIYGQQSTLDHPQSREFDPETRDYDLPGRGSLVRRERSLSAHATGLGDHVFVVGGAMAQSAEDKDKPRPARYSAEGPTDDGRDLPDLAAASEDGPSTPGLLAAGYFSGSVAGYAGTSGAAPLVARTLAELIADDKVAADTSKQDAIVAILKKPLPAHDPRLGFGSLGRPALPGRLVRRRVQER